MHADIFIVDYGSQYTLLIERRLKEQGCSATIVQADSFDSLENKTCRGIILSGSPDSLSEEKTSAQLPTWLWSANIPVLGICYGLHLLTKEFGGLVEKGEYREYGKSTIFFSLDNNQTGKKFLGLLEHKQDVWMSHGDHVALVGPDFDCIAKTKEGAVAAIAHKSRPMLGVQFHPEVFHTNNGFILLKNFAQEVCGIASSTEKSEPIPYLLQEIKGQVGDKKVLLAVSGGVDSTVAAALLTKALGGSQVTCVLVDHGLMRKNERLQVEQSFSHLGIPLKAIDESEIFLKKLEGIKDPETKRKIVGKTFIESFENFTKKFGPFDFLGQGTLFPDIIESACFGAKAKVIKSHHNVGGLPKRLQLKLVEPLRFMFKDEVRAIGKELNLPKEMMARHPFPGPGLAIRIVGEITKEKINLLQEADDIFISSLKDSGYYDKIWQAGAILLPVKSVGVMGDDRTYEWTCVLRAVHAVDAMTAEVGELPLNFLTQVASQIVRKVEGINRVLYDITSKPPATIEWE